MVVAPVMEGCMRVWMDGMGCRGCIVMEQQHDITALPAVKDLC